MVTDSGQGGSTFRAFGLPAQRSAISYDRKAEALREPIGERSDLSRRTNSPTAIPD